MRWLRCILIAVFVTQGCIEEFPAETQGLETLLVVEALITDTPENHKVQLSRVFAFEESQPAPERNASVQVVDDQGEEFRFEETEPGVYLSQNVFAAQQGRSYELKIKTADGKEYSSTQVAVPNRIPVGEIRAERILNDDGEEGVGVFLDNTSSGSEPNFFRYEFDETYKIIAPRWDPFRFEVVRYMLCVRNPFVVETVLWEDERRTCFGTSKSEQFIQATSAGLDGNANDNFQLHFISRDNYIISHRYSINVIQYSQTQDAYSYYERLLDFSSTPDVFSQVQPGFLEGNLSLESNSNEKVLGYFEVASVSEKRMYFNYEDLFPNEPLPPYPTSCESFGNPPIIPPGYTCLGIMDCEIDCDSPLIEAILAEEVVFAGVKEGDPVNPYYTWPSPCGDCTKLGSNVVPEFWSEE